MFGSSADPFEHKLNQSHRIGHHPNRCQASRGALGVNHPPHQRRGPRGESTVILYQLLFHERDQTLVELKKMRRDAADIETRRRGIDNSVLRSRWDNDHVSRLKLDALVIQVKLSYSAEHVDDFDEGMSPPFHCELGAVMALQDQHAPFGEFFVQRSVG